MKQHERMVLPHAVYRLYDEGGTLLYVGFSSSIWRRLGSHQVPSRPWYQEIATIKVVWYPDELAGRRAEAAAILDEHPRHNVMTPDPANVGSHLIPRAIRPPRGNGVNCPKCGKPKEHRKSPYCRACAANYRQVRRLKQLAAGAPH